MDHHNKLKGEASSVNARNKKIGLFFLIAPFVGLILILVGWTIASFIISSLIASTPTSGVVTPIVGSSDMLTTVARIINATLSFFGILCVIGIIVGIPIGIFFMAKEAPDDSTV